MKKLFISIMAVAFSLSSMATETATAHIKLVGSNTTYATNIIRLTEDDARNSSYESGYDSERMMNLSNPFSVLLYGFVGNIPCELVATDNLDGLMIGFTTNMLDADYKLVFSNVSGRALKLYDRVLNTEIDIVNDAEYNFSVDASLVGQHEVNDRFFINLSASDFAFSLTTNEEGWASFSNDVDAILTAPAGLKIYTGRFNGIDKLHLVQVDFVKTNEGVVALGAPNTTYYFAAGEGSSVYETNDLKPSSEAAEAGASIFVLNGNALTAFEGSELPANSAYLPVSADPAPEAIALSFEDPTAVENVEASVKSEKMIENGQLLIRRGNAVYTIQGQVVK